jgi:pyruvate ferredoxin oxidoreductase gamma subunit
MMRVRIHGRGGQGVVTAAELLAEAAFRQGRHAQAFPFFGSERTGAPVVAFCRIDDAPIRARDPVTTPDAVIVQDLTLLGHVDVLAGLAQDGYVLLDSPRRPADLGPHGAPPPDGTTVVPVPATAIARRHLGRPLPNTPLLGAFAAATGVVSVDAVVAALLERFPGAVGRRNADAARVAYELVLGPADRFVPSPYEAGVWLPEVTRAAAG